MKKLVVLLALLAMSTGYHDGYCITVPVSTIIRTSENFGLVDKVYNLTGVDFIIKQAENLVTVCDPKILTLNEKIELLSYSNNLYIDGDKTKIFFPDYKNEPIEIIRNDTFSNLKDLTTIAIENLAVKKLEPHVFRGLDLEHLSLENTELTSLDMVFSDDLPNLATLRIIKNKVEVIRDDTFTNLKNVVVLFLDLDNLKELEPSAFKGLQELKELHITAPLLTAIPKEIFNDLRSLDALSLTNHNIQTIDEHIFSSLSDLSYLDIEVSPFFSEGWQKDLSSLSRLRFRANKEYVIKSGEFQDLKGLKQLHIKANHVIKIEKDAFKGLDELKFLNINATTSRTLDFDMAHEVRDNLKHLQLFYVSPNVYDCKNLDEAWQILYNRRPY